MPFVLKSIAGKFTRYVIYDVGSKDNTRDIIEWFEEAEKHRAEFFIRYLPMVPREVQGCFRNSQIIESQSNYYLIIDGDEIWSGKALEQLPLAISNMENSNGKIYGVCRRREISYDLTMAYSEIRTHHRIYSSQKAYWQGSHPGEEAVVPQKPSREVDMPSILINHFHNTLRSPTEDIALKRIERKGQKTYHPGELISFNLLEELPILKAPIENFPVSPILNELWRDTL